MTAAAVILDAEGLSLTAQESDFFRAADPWGFILFARNIDNPEQVRRLCGELREAVGRDAVITVDQEGGRVQRLGPPHWRQWTPPLDFVEAAGADAELALFLRYRIIADELRAVGIDSDCAPMADLARSETHPFLRNRCLGSDPAEVARLAQAAASGLLTGGVLPVLKHMPGHGRALVDSHKELPRVEAEPELLHDTDFEAFRLLADLPVAMTAHLVYSRIDDRPATASPVMMRLIREEIGYDGLLMSDDLRMEAMEGSPAERTRAALDAGCDIALYCNEPLSVREAVAEAAGPLTPEAARRAEAALAARRAPDPVDIPAMEAKLDAILKGGADG
ncbi:beta-N-acetylhexosaminidase [Aquicoccus sp. SCR17]|nr:beta-N-acetylhexosaminidase [Carideicomes alvinocaridis]